MTNQQIAATIAQQMGGTGRLHAMVGASNFVAIDKGLQFGFKGSRNANKCLVVLEPTDTYTLELWKIRRSGEATLVTHQEQVYADGLIPIFEAATGLRLVL